MHATHEHARRTLVELASRRGADKTIGEIACKELLLALGLTPRHYAKTYGQVASLLDVTCLLQNLPLIGRLIKFERSSDEVGLEWSLWRPHMAEIDAATLAKQWSDEDFSRLLSSFPSVSAKKWWKQHEADSAALLKKALSVARGQNECCLTPRSS